MERDTLWKGAVLAVAAAVALAFSNGEFASPVAAWIAPVLALRLTRAKPAWRALLAGYAAFLAGWLVAWPGVFRITGIALAPTAVILSAIGFLPYLADRLAVHRLPPLAALLVFPAATVLVELGLARVSPFGSWGMIAYSQVEFAPVAQLAALTGAAGVSFLVCWFGSLGAWVWEHWREPARFRTPAIVFAAAAAVTLAWGTARLAARPGDTVRIAALFSQEPGNSNYDTANAPAIEARLLAQVRAAASHGAQLIVWPEDSFFIDAAAEPAMLARAAAEAHAAHALLGIAYGLRAEPGKLAYRNRFVLIDPSGAVAWRYDKSFPVPGYEQKNMIPGDKRIARFRAAIGEVAGAICFDGDHDAIMRQTGGARLILLPSDDWPAITTLHARMVRMRAIEQGAPVVRPTINGRLLIADRFGRELAAAVAREPRAAALIADVPLAPGG